MKRQQTLWQISSLVVCLFVFAGCGSRQVDPGKITMVEQSVTRISDDAEPFDMENCSGRLPVEQTFSKEVAVTFSGEVKASVEIEEIFTAKIRAFYEHRETTQQTVHLTVPAGTHTIYTVSWWQELHSGLVGYLGYTQTDNYAAVVPTGSTVTSRDVPCETAPPVPPTPQPTVTQPDPQPVPSADTQSYVVNRQSDNDPNIWLATVTTTPRATLLTFVIAPTQDAHDLTINPPGNADAFFLMDGQCRCRYRLIATDSRVPAGRPFDVRVGQRVEFTLTFEPIPNNIQTLNVIEGAHTDSSATYWDFTDVVLIP